MTRRFDKYSESALKTDGDRKVAGLRVLDRVNILEKSTRSSEDGKSSGKISKVAKVAKFIELFEEGEAEEKYPLSSKDGSRFVEVERPSIWRNITATFTWFDNEWKKLKNLYKATEAELPMKRELRAQHFEVEWQAMCRVYNCIRVKLAKESTLIELPDHEDEGIWTQIKSILRLSDKSFDLTGSSQVLLSSRTDESIGGRFYFEPYEDWRRYGLRVRGLFPDPEPDEWMSMVGRPGEWCVGFHGTGASGISALKDIVETLVVSKAIRNEYAGRPATNRKEPIPEIGVYLAQNVESCSMDLIQVGETFFHVALQCRYHPKHVWDVGNGFLVIDSPLYVRPDGILVKEVIMRER